MHLVHTLKRRARHLAWIAIATTSLGAAATFTSSIASSAATSAAAPLLIARAPSSSTLYVLTSQPCAKSLCLQLARTQNNGSSFQARTLPTISAVRGVATGTLDALRFASVRDGYAILGANGPKSLYVTTDGAKTWHQVFAKKGVTIMSLSPSATTLYAIGATCHTTKHARSCDDFRLARAPLDASTWTFAALPNLAVQSGFFDTDIAAAGKDLWISQQSKRSLVEFSSNAGATWTTHAAAPLASVSGCALTATSSTHLWAACPTGMLESFFYSNDAGSTWRGVHQKPFAGTGGGYFDPVSSAVAYLDYGGARALVRVSAEGRTSTTVGSIGCSSSNASVNALDFTNDKDGLAVCVPNGDTTKSELEATSNGGVTWLQIAAPSQHG